MKILHILYSGLGGHGNVFFSMVSADNNKEFEYEALFNGVEEIRDEYIQKCKIFNINWNFLKKESPGFSLQFYKQFASHIKQSDAEILFLHSSSYILPAIMANFSLKKKKIIIIRETQANNLKTRQNWFWLMIAFLFADKIVFLSEEYKTEIKRKLKGFYKESRVSVIPNGINLNLYRPAKQTKPNFLWIGMQSRLTDNKDHITLLRAFALLKPKHKNIKLAIAGDGPCKPELIALVDKLKIAADVELRGMLEEKQLIEFLLTVHIYVHASFGETMSTSIMQAMACGLPVIASDVPGIKNMILHDKTGLLVPLKNEAMMASTIEELLNNDTKALVLSENALAYAQQHFSNINMFKKYKTLFYT